MIGNKVTELRGQFDQSFAAPPRTDLEQLETLIAIRVAGDPYALRIGEINSLASDRKIVPLPSATPELLGAAGVRGAVVPVFSLAALLGYGLGLGSARWLALCGTDEPLALAFSDFEGCVQVVRDQLVNDVARTPELVRTVLSIPSLVEEIKERSGRRRASKEI